MKKKTHQKKPKKAQADRIFRNGMRNTKNNQEKQRETLRNYNVLRGEDKCFLFFVFVHTNQNLPEKKQRKNDNL